MFWLELMNELEEAEIRLEMRRVYKDIGFIGALQCLYEILLSASILSEIIAEEHEKESKERMEP